MIEKFRSPALWLGLAGVAKLALRSFNIEITDSTIDDIANGIAAVFTVVGVWASHKPKAEIAPEK